jgi:ATP adenylyltransferase/5',5'''-P-1,P-4-tetraphosphate phosphorylase II
VNYFPPNKNKKNETNKLEKERIFEVRPEAQNDIYSLYTVTKDGLEPKYHSIAMIPDYKTSVFMNSIFRNIKENNNLDKLEESDSEDEFENNDKNKFVCVLNKKMVCTFHSKFNKWIPLRLVNE